MPAKKYATVTDLDEFKTEVRGEFRAVREEIRANSLNGLRPTLMALAKREENRMESHHAWQRVGRDIMAWLHLPHELGRRWTNAFIAGVGLVVAEKLGEWTGFWGDIAHHLPHLP